MRNPVFPVTSGASPALMSASQTSDVRRSCQTIAGAIGSPVRRSQMTVVSRWFVTPTAATSLAETPALRRHARATAS